MSARGDQRRKGRFELGEGHIVGGDVAPYVVDRHEGLFQHEAARLGEVRADQQRAYKPRRACRRHGVEVGKLYPGLPDGLPHDGGYLFGVLARGYLGNDATVKGVHIYL